MKTLFLHIGRGKTGTTAIQAFLAQNRDALLDCGVDYLLAGDRGLGLGHQDFAKSFIAAPPAYMTPAARPEEIRAETARQICESPVAHVLISSENFPLADIDALKNWIDALPIDLQVRIVFFARSQDELAESEYNQMVKLKGETRSPVAYAMALEGADFAAECDAWAEQFGVGGIIARIYDGAAGDVVARFLACLPGVRQPEEMARKSAAPDAYANRSLGARALLAAQLLNGVKIDGRDALYQRMFAGFEASRDIPAVLLSVSEARAVRAAFAQSNARFARSYLRSDNPRHLSGDLGGRRYDDAARDRLNRAVRHLFLDPNTAATGPDQ